jgi:DNA-binding MarR family transcriptional regulator
VARTDDAKDRRARIISLTDAGRELISTAFADHRIALDRAVGGFTREEREALLPLLRRLGRTAEKNL